MTNHPDRGTNVVDGLASVLGDPSHGPRLAPADVLYPRPVTRPIETRLVARTPGGKPGVEWQERLKGSGMVQDRLPFS